MKRFILGLICLICCFRSFGQKDCVQTLADAESEFASGHFYGLSSLLKECLETNGFTSEQQVRAHKLLTQAYLLTDDPIAAEDSYLRLLKADPEYVSDEKDPIDVFYLSKKFTATPKFTPTLARLGPGVSFARIIHRNNTNSLGDIKYKQSLKTGFQLGAGIDWNINDFLSLGTDANISFKTFTSSANGIFASDVHSSVPDEQISTEKQWWIDVPLYFKYSKQHGRIRPFGYAGVALNVLLSDRVQLEYINRSPGLETGSSIVENRTQGPDIDVTYKRNWLNRSLVVGGGFRYKFGKDFFVVDLRYMAGLSNVTNTNANFYNAKTTSGYQIGETIAKYSFVGDYFRVDNLSLSVGFVKPLYDPRKIKKARAKSAMKAISKSENK